MEYWLTSPGDHLDFGFGITAETYYNSAKYMDEGRHKIQAFQLIEMPINFLYRHSIELALKSLIIIFIRNYLSHTRMILVRVQSLKS